MQIKEYLFYYPMKRAEFAKKAGIHINTLNNICSGKFRTISTDVCEKIINASDGKVTLRDIMNEIKGIPPTPPADKDG